jgi:putative nucleotidyltransferase with HDIG domain
MVKLYTMGIKLKNIFKKKIIEKFKSLITKEYFLNIILSFFILINLFILIIDFLILPPLRIGEPAPKNIEAPRTIVYIDREETERLKNLLLSQFKPIYRIDQNITLENLKKLDDIFINRKEISEKSKKYLSSIPISRIEEIMNRIEVWLSDIYSKGITLESLDVKRKDFITFLKREFNLPSYFAEEISQILIKPNMDIDEKETELKKQELLKSIRPIEKLISKGDIIVKKGEIINEEKYKILDMIGLTTSFRNILKFFGILGFIILFQISQKLFFLRIVQNKDRSSFILSQLLFSFGLFLIKVFYYISSFLTPIPSIFLLFSCFLNISYSILVGMQLSILIGIINNSFFLLFQSFINLLIISYFLREIEDRSKFIKIGFYLFLSNILTIILFNFFSGEKDLQFSEIMSSIVNPFLSIIFALGLLPFLENIFRIATPLRLLELSNPNHPLLHRLFLEAPGTYYHSLIVGNLAERAAEAVSANVYLVRVASLYHDIGKIKRPQYFIENLMPGQSNPHNSLNPYISTLIIRNHPKEGAKIANVYKFPQSIIEIIEQHHGTSVISYFYHKQKELSKNSPNKDDFRYLGPKPKSKEAVIVMLADSIEAATRSLPNPNPEVIEKIVRNIITERIEDGQLELANLTLEELEKISQSYIKTLLRMRHPRIPYPQESSNFKK